MPSTYPYMKVGTRSERAEPISALLLELGAVGLERRDQETMISSPGEQVTLVAWFESLDQARNAADQLHLFPAADGVEIRVGEVEDPGWREAWRDYFRPMKFGRKLWVTPIDENPTESDDDTIAVVKLLPSGAFGTGTHESTAMMLELVEETLRPGAKVLDVGCGSGILSIAAVLLGARRAWGIDIDPEAVGYARENSTTNGTVDRCRFDTTPLAEITERFDLVLANLSAPVLIAEKAQLAERVADRGLLMWSGLLENDLAEVGAAPNMDLATDRRRDDWVAQVWSPRRK